jgi:hypothetical protein
MRSQAEIFGEDQRLEILPEARVLIVCKDLQSMKKGTFVVPFFCLVSLNCIRRNCNIRKFLLPDVSQLLIMRLHHETTGGNGSGGEVYCELHRGVFLLLLIFSLT